MKELLEYSKSVKLQADTLLQQTQLIPLLEKFGTVTITGSYSANIMYNKDIDIYLITDKGFEIKEVLEIHNTIFRKKIVNGNILLGNNKDMTNLEQNFPSGFYIGLKFKIKQENNIEKWKIDIWCIDEIEYKKIKYKNLEKKVNEENQPLLLQIKQYVNNNGLDIPSVRIYDAVFEDNVKSIEEFKKLII